MSTDPDARRNGPQRDGPGDDGPSGRAARRLLSVVFECADAEVEGRFWEAVLGWVRLHDTRNWVTVVDPADRTHRLSFQRVDDHQPPTWPARTRPQRAHLDVLVDDLETADRRVTALGARRLSETAVLHEDESFIVYADPAGHPFCCIQQATPDL
jgi:catechol 2,3-dioxygenase-like lactoylglutathione lyase family enzyme